MVIALTAVQRGITHVLVGARDAAQARENARGGEIELSPEDVTAMNAIAAGLGACRAWRRSPGVASRVSYTLPPPL